MTTGTELRLIAAGLAETATPHQILLTGGPISLRVSSTSPAPLTALAAAATPYLRPTGPDHPQRTPELVRIYPDPALAERLHQLTDGSADTAFASSGRERERASGTARRSYCGMTPPRTPATSSWTTPARPPTGWRFVLSGASPGAA